MKIGTNIGHVLADFDMSAWLNVLKPFPSVRWLDVLRTNQVWWEAKLPGAFVPRLFLQLPPETDVTPADVWWKWHGLAPSWCLRRSLEMNADCWLTLPHRFRFDEFSKYARSLKPIMAEFSQRGLELRVELGGEIFNSNFMHRYEFEKLAADGYKGALRLHAERTIEMSRAFVSEQVDAEIVLSCHATNTWMCEYMLAETAVAGHIDALAIAPYAGQNAVDKSTIWRDLWRVGQDCLDYAKLARAGDFDLHYYEAGQHVDSAETVAWNRSAWMGNWYRDYLDTIMAVEPTTIHIYPIAGVYHEDGKKGEGWGLYEIKNGEFVPTPKLDAVMAYV